jgi:hypothetical protein
MLVKNIFSNPIHGIAPGEEGELPKNRESRLNQYVKYGMLEVIETKPKEKKKTDLTRESSKTDFGTSKVGALSEFCDKEGIEVPDGATKDILIKTIFKELFEQSED